MQKWKWGGRNRYPSKEKKKKKRVRGWIAGFSWNTRKSKLSVRALGRVLDNEAGKVGTLDFSKQF